MIIQTTCIAESYFKTSIALEVRRPGLTIRVTNFQLRSGSHYYDARGCVAFTMMFVAM